VSLATCSNCYVNTAAAQSTSRRITSRGQFSQRRRQQSLDRHDMNPWHSKFGPSLHWNYVGSAQLGAGSARVFSSVSNGRFLARPRDRTCPTIYVCPKKTVCGSLSFAFWSRCELQSFFSCVKRLWDVSAKGVIYDVSNTNAYALNPLRRSSISSLYGIWSYLETSSGFDNSSLHTHNNLAHG
jgi:hypothetical protein